MKNAKWAVLACIAALPLDAQVNTNLTITPQTQIANPLDTYRKVLELREQQERVRQLQEQTRQIEEQRAATQRRQEAEKQRAAVVGGLNLTMKQLLGEDGFKLTGLYLLNSEQLTILDKWVSLYSADVAKRFSAPPVPRSEAVESEINGEFHGWSGDTTFELANGQVWKQSAYDYEYEYDYRPKVVIYPIGSIFKMKVDGVKGAVEVQRVK
jgi:hypothetical protein